MSETAKINVDNINWNDLWDAHAGEARPPEFWDGRVEEFSAHAIDGPYSKNFMAFLKPSPNWTVLDMGSGSGTLSLPLAQTVKAVTAADFAPKMLAALRGHAQKRGLNNITTVRLSWTDDWDAVIAPKSHDVAIASRSLAMGGFAPAVKKLMRVARQRVYLSLYVDSGDRHQLLYEALGRKTAPPPDYIYCHNILYQMGIRPNLHMLTEYEPKAYKTREDIYKSLTKRFAAGLNAAETAKINAYLDKHLQKTSLGWVLDTAQPYRSAIIWWDVEKDVADI